MAFVLSITEKGMPVVDGIKLQRLRQLVLGERRGTGAGTGLVAIRRFGNAARFVLAACSQAVTPGGPAALAHHLPHAHLLQAS